jgi:hypothetical protein
MSAVTKLRRRCNICGSSCSTKPHAYSGWTGLTLCPQCIGKLEAQVELMVNRAHSEIVGKFGLSQPRSDWDRDRWADILRQDATNSVIKGLHSYYHDSNEPVVVRQRSLPGVRWRTKDGRFASIDLTGFEEA